MKPSQKEPIMRKPTIQSPHELENKPPMGSSILYPLPFTLYPLSSILCALSSILHPLSSILYPLSSILYPLSAIIYPKRDE